MYLRIILLLLLVQLISCSGESEETISEDIQKEKELFEQIKVGMHRDEVISILGEPDKVKYDNVDSSSYWYKYFTKKKSEFTSTMPYILFDSTADTVTFATYGD